MIKAMSKKCIQINGARVLVMGLSFKENCPDIRNTRVIDIVLELSEFNCNVDVFDPWVSAKEVENEFGIKTIDKLSNGEYDGIILAVAHNEFRAMGAEGIRALCKPQNILYDLKYVLTAEESDLRL